ncbi:winged helix-turn-helix transcriptional regulator [Candidatus Bathyarchaeota archaeon]|nr:winged helix-turn-helix transcriptional regulator [Candidatus Bathyarchaeota archaeon]
MLKLFSYGRTKIRVEYTMAPQRNNPRISRKNREAALPEEVSEAISEAGGLDHLLSAIRPNEIKADAALHKILSDETRLVILRAIRQCDMCPCVLKVLMNISDSRLSYHLTVLEEAGLVRSYKKKN